MFCYIFFTSLAFLFTSNVVRTSSLESSDEPRRPLKIDLGALKNAAEMVKVVKALNEDVSEPDSLQVGYGDQEEKRLQGIDLDYLGVNGERQQKIQELLELIQKNRDAKEKFDLTRSEFTPRLYFISNPDVLERYKVKIKMGQGKDSSESTDLNGSSEKDTELKNLWDLLKAMRREGDADKKVFPKQMIHPRLLHLNLEDNVPSFGTNIYDDNEEVKQNKEIVKEGAKQEKEEPNLQFLQIITEAKKDNEEKLTTAKSTTKMASLSVEVTEKDIVKDALRTAGFKYHIQEDDKDDQSDEKKDSSDKSDESEKRTRIDFKAKAGSNEFDEEETKRKRQKEGKKDTEFDDNDDFMKKSKVTYESPSKKKETKFDNNDSLDYNKNKQNRWDKPEGKRENKNKREKPADRITEKFNFKPKPRKVERNNEMNRPKNKPENSRPVRNKMTKLRDDNVGKSLFKSFGRTPIPIVGKRGIYEDD